ncbi:MAG: hypothetical protein GF317_09150 [Candidatus Lokiarchaeota archaeon]|nr:hypothetical protein [Candidatus Lokiarchaeota archaeon]MBD3199877.1 hypothetical protein [Candidatus Lokiarchaeota archaeon]
MASLIITEKNKAAFAVAEALGKVKSIKEANNLKIYSVPSENIYVIPLRGHILEYKNSEQYKSWTKSDPREIITNPDAIKKYPKKYAFPYIKALKKYSKKVNECLISTDADVEGCTIGLYDALPFVKQANANIKISQLWLSSLQKNEILKKYKNPISPKWKWAETGDTRAIIDAVIGFSATRKVTNTLQPLLQKVPFKFTSIGRVQTSLLYLIYLRDTKIKEFKPKDYYTIEAILNSNNIEFKAFHENNPFQEKDKLKARSIFQKIKDEKLAVINNKSNKFNEVKPPSPLNTSKALILLTKNLHISADLALKTMNTLYLNKIITYPRTDSDIYPVEFKHRLLIKKFNNHSMYGEYAFYLINNNRFNPTKGKKNLGDHPPITPLESLEKNDAKFENNLQKKVYDILTRHYLALFGPSARESKLFLKLLIRDELFNSNLVNLVSEGFLKIAPFLKRRYDRSVKLKDKTIPIKEILHNKKNTKPPPEYTDTSLLKLMEKNNLGTKSTRPVIIKILEKRGYVNRIGKKFRITNYGVFLIENLEKIWLPFLRPKFTSIVEELLEQIKTGKKSKAEVLGIIKNLFLNLYDKFVENEKKIKSNIEDFKTTNKSRDNTTKDQKKITSANCPHCNKEKMKLVIAKGNKKFFVCLNKDCKEKYLSVPKKGRTYLLKSCYCSICGFNILKIYTRKNGKSFHYYMCPNCWTEGIKAGDSGKGFCSSCSNYKIQNNKCIKR